MNNPFIVMNSGTEVDLIEPTIESLHLSDIAFNLARIRRFNGATEANCSVALHSVMGSHLAFNRDYAIEFLLHDAHEAYFGDMSSPVKQLLGRRYKIIVDYFDDVLYRRFGVERRYQHEIKHYDLQCLKYERNRFMPISRRPWPVLANVSTTSMATRLQVFNFDRYYSSNDPSMHEELFLKRASELGIK